MPDQPHILTGFHFTKATLTSFGERCRIVGHMDSPTPTAADIPAGTAATVQAIVSTGSVGISDAMMAALPRLSLFCCYGTGYERVDLEAARRRGIMVTHGADANAPDVAELAVGILLASTRRLVRADKMIRRGEWKQRIPNRFGPIAGLTGGKVGILGLGAIGLEVARRLKGFDVEIGYCNRSRRSDVDFPYFPDVMALATWCDYLIVCLRSDASNRHIINAEVLKALGPNGILVNVGRGTVVDEQALIKALKDRTILSAGLDVFEDEPRVPAELIAIEHAVLLPHVGSASVHTREAMGQLLVDNLVSWFDGKGPLTPVSETPWKKA